MKKATPLGVVFFLPRSADCGHSLVVDEEMNSLCIQSNVDLVADIRKPIVRNCSEHAVRTGIEVNMACATKSLDQHDAAMQCSVRSTIRSGFADIDFHIVRSDSKGHGS